MARRPTRLTVGMFVLELPQLAAQVEGYFGSEGIDVQFERVGSSTEQFRDLDNGRYDLVLTAPDNVINYRYNTTRNALGRRLDVQLLDGLDRGMGLRLVAQRGTDAAMVLRGQNIAVDATDSGFAFVLYEILRRNGLEFGEDYQVTAVGGVLQRFQALLEGSIDATLLSHGFELRAASDGASLLDPVTDIADPYFGYCTAGRATWLQDNRDVVVGYLRATYRSLLWSLDPANRDRAIELLTNENTPAELAERLYEMQTASASGLIPDMRVSRDGLQNVIALRTAWDGFDQPQDAAALAAPSSGLYDLSFYQEATA